MLGTICTGRRWFVYERQRQYDHLSGHDATQITEQLHLAGHGKTALELIQIPPYKGGHFEGQNLECELLFRVPEPIGRGHQFAGSLGRFSSGSRRWGRCYYAAGFVRILSFRHDGKKLGDQRGR